MTLIAGFKANDGFVIAADTEITQGAINYQNSKLLKYFSEKDGYTLIIGGAGHVSYFTMAAQKIRDTVATLNAPSLEKIRNAIDAAILTVHTEYIFKFWEAGEANRPSFDLISGICDGKSGSVLLRSEDAALVEITSHDFIGSGASLARHVAERLLQPGLTLPSSPI